METTAVTLPVEQKVSRPEAAEGTQLTSNKQSLSGSGILNSILGFKWLSEEMHEIHIESPSYYMPTAQSYISLRAATASRKGSWALDTQNSHRFQWELQCSSLDSKNAVLDPELWRLEPYSISVSGNTHL